MSLDSDVALLGTGIAPLVAANQLLAQGKSVLILNPDWDFFLEDSELPLDPLLQMKPTTERLLRSSPENALSVLRPDFPGAVEFWSTSNPSGGFHDPAAPHVRQRGRLWISALEQDRLWNWEELEDLYVEASDAGMNPQILEGITAARKFPGFSANSGHFKGLFLPKLCDVDTVRYRNGLLEFVRERLDANRFICAATQIELIPEGIRFYSKGSLHTARLNLGMLACWTPRLSPWILNQAKKAEVSVKLPKGVRLWEQWSINSRETPDPSTVGMFGDMAVWADFEGLPLKNQGPARLAVLRAGPVVPIQDLYLPQAGLSWGSSESFSSLSKLCQGFLKWDRFSVRTLRPRAIFEWESPQPWRLTRSDLKIQVLPACDGPLVEIVRQVRAVCDQLLQES